MSIGSRESKEHQVMTVCSCNRARGSIKRNFCCNDERIVDCIARGIRHSPVTFPLLQSQVDRNETSNLSARIRPAANVHSAGGACASICRLQCPNIYFPMARNGAGQFQQSTLTQQFWIMLHCRTKRSPDGRPRQYDSWFTKGGRVGAFFLQRMRSFS
jgi:hypothetical protein